MPRQIGSTALHELRDARRDSGLDQDRRLHWLLSGHHPLGRQAKSSVIRELEDIARRARGFWGVAPHLISQFRPSRLYATIACI